MKELLNQLKKTDIEELLENKNIEFKKSATKKSLIDLAVSHRVTTKKALEERLKAIEDEIKAKKREEYLSGNVWLYNGKPFTNDDIGDYVGFCYLITLDNGKKYIGRKMFHSKRKVKGRRNRVTMISDWKTYYSSSEYIKEYIKNGGDCKREILTLHRLQRDITYTENALMFKLNVLTEKDEDGNLVYLNDNIGALYFRDLYHDIKDRTDSVYNFYD